MKLLASTLFLLVSASFIQAKRSHGKYPRPCVGEADESCKKDCAANNDPHDCLEFKDKSIECKCVAEDSPGRLQRKVRPKKSHRKFPRPCVGADDEYCESQCAVYNDPHDCLEFKDKSIECKCVAEDSSVSRSLVVTKSLG